MRLIGNKGMWAVVMCLGLIAPSIFARDVEITLNDGRKVRGTLVSERSDAIILRVSGVESTYQRSRIKNMVSVLSLEDEYKTARAKVKDDDYTGRFKVARDLYNKKSREADLLALAEVESILKDKPGHLPSVALKSALTTRIKAAPPVTPAAVPSPPTAPSALPTPTQPAAPSTSATGTTPMLLDKSDINLMKVYEIQLKNNPTVVVTRTIAEKILATQRENPAMAEFLGRDGERKFRSLKQLELLDLIFAIGDRSIYKDVLIRTEPQTLKYYRTKINAIYVRGYCGKCHANPRNPAPGLTLFSQLSEAGAYSNLALLRHMENKDGIPLIFPPTPEKSPLFQYGLPPEAARTPHPQVPKLRPFFKNAEDPRYLDWLEWTSLLWGQNENYPVKIMGP